MISQSLEDSYALGERIGRCLRPGDFIALRGPLGVGKTQIVRGISEGYLGSREGVCSPSFTVLNIYHGGGRKIHHLDLYRLSSLEDLESTGYWEFVEDRDALVLVEWLEQVPGAEPKKYVVLTLSFVGEEDDEAKREIILSVEEDEDLSLRLREVFDD